MIFAAIFDGWLWGRWPDPFTLAGAILECAAGALTLRSTRAAETTEVTE